MAVVVIQELPEMTTLDMYDAVNERLGVDRDPPEGLIIHAGGADDSGRIRVVDVWESEDAFERFANDRLGPAIAAVAGEAGVDASQMPSASVLVYEAREVIQPAAAPH